MAGKKQEVKIEELKAKFLEYYRELPVQKLAGESVGRDETTVWRWIQEDQKFANQVQNAKAEWAKRMSKGVRSKEWLLERVIKDHFSPRTEVKHGGSITNYTIEVTDTPASGPKQGISGQPQVPDTMRGETVGEVSLGENNNPEVGA